MNFAESENYLMSLGNEVETMKLGLDNIRLLLRALGDPQQHYFKVQVAGTNGKGSVCAFLDAICSGASVPTGTFTSPHLVSITERIRINGRDIDEEAFARTATIVREKIDELIGTGELKTTPTFFEQITAIALAAFVDAGVKVAILETGLGGRLDATTAADAEIAAITRIDLDHREYLGGTIEEIAAEKAAIIGAHTLDVVIGGQSKEVIAILRRRCEQFGIEPISDGYEPWRVLPVDAHEPWRVRAGDDQAVMVSLSQYVHPPIRLGLRGRHQAENAQVAVQSAYGLMVHGVLDRLYDPDGEELILRALTDARYPGRLEYDGRYLFDGAHNIGGVRALVAYLEEFESRPFTLVYGAMNDKDIVEMTNVLFPLAKRIILTQPTNKRSLTSREIRERAGDRFNVIETGSVGEAIEVAETGEPELIVVTGSLYLIGEVKFLRS